MRPLDFIVLGLPRSGTTWCANWLTTDRSLCLHDPFATQRPEHWPDDGRRRGISCTGAYLFPRWLRSQTCPVAVIEREPRQCATSLARMGMGLHDLPERLAATPGRRWAFADLWDESRARALWAYLLPGVPFDALRYRLLRDMRVEPLNPTADTDVLVDMLTRETEETPPCPGV